MRYPSHAAVDLPAGKRSGLFSWVLAARAAYATDYIRNSPAVLREDHTNAATRTNAYSASFLFEQILACN